MALSVLIVGVGQERGWETEGEEFLHSASFSGWLYTGPMGL